MNTPDSVNITAKVILDNVEEADKISLLGYIRIAEEIEKALELKGWVIIHEEAQGHW